MWWVEGPMTLRGGWANPVAKDMAHPVHSMALPGTWGRERWDKAYMEEKRASDHRLQLREAQAPSLPLYHRPPAMWAVGLSQGAHHGLGSWVSIGGLGYQKTPQHGLWLLGIRGDSWGWVWWQGYFCAPSANFCESSSLSYKRRCQCAQVQEILVNSLWGTVGFSVPLPFNFRVQPAVQLPHSHLPNASAIRKQSGKGNVKLNFDFMGSAELDWAADVKESTTSLVEQHSCMVLGCCVGAPVLIRSFISNCVAFCFLYFLMVPTSSPCWKMSSPSREMKTQNCWSGWYFHVPVAHVSYLVSSGRAFSSSSQLQDSSWSWALLLLTLRVPRSDLLFSSLCMTCYHETSYQQQCCLEES